MSLAKLALRKLQSYTPKKWYIRNEKEIARAAYDAVARGNAVLGGGILTEGTTVSASVVQVDVTAIDAKLDGSLKVQTGAQSDSDLFTTASDIGQPIFADGATAAAISLATDETAYVSVILVDSDGADDVTGDNGAALLVAVVAGTAATYEDQSAFLTDIEIHQALIASTGVHAATGGWARVADILWDENSASPTTTVTVNRDA